MKTVGTLTSLHQAAMEGCEGFDYLTYAKNRFDEYYGVKEREYVAKS